MKPEVPQEPQTDERGRQLIGTYYDTTFGQVKANAFFNFNLPINADLSDTFLQERSIDSAVLKIPYDQGSFGDIETTQTIEFYQLEETITEDAIYGANASFDYSNEPVARWTGKFDPSGSFRVQLNERFLNQIRQADISQFTNNANFQNFFQGLAAIPANDFDINNKGGFAYWELINQASIVFYQPNGVRDSVLADQRSARVNTYDFDRTGALAQPGQFNNQFGFLQPLGGLKTTIRFKELGLLLKEGRINVHKAELIMPISRKYHDGRQPPDYIEMWADDNGEKSLTDTARFIDEQQVYREDKARYIQELLTAKSDDRQPQYGALNIRIPFEPPRGNPLLIKGANNPKGQGVKLILTLSKVEE